MATYPIVLLNDVNCTDATSDRYGLDPTNPPRIVNMPSIQSVSVMGRDGSLPTPQGAHPSPMFTVILVLAGAGSTLDIRSDDTDALIDMWAALVTTPSVAIEYRVSAARKRYGNGRVSSFEVTRPNLDYAVVTIVLELLTPFWRGAVLATEQSMVVASSMTLSVDYVGTAPILDGQVAILGPATNPKVTDLGSGDWWSYTGVVLSTERLVFDSTTLTARKGLSGSTTFQAGGASVNTAIRVGGTGAFAPTAFRITPRPLSVGALPDAWRAAFTLSASSTSSATRVEVSARKAIR